MNQAVDPMTNEDYFDDDSDDEAPDLIEVSVVEDEVDAQDKTTTPTVSKPISSNELPGTQPHEEDSSPCPVTILSGFLGSGKTTLIQYILKSPDHQKRIAVIENEFGEGLAIETLIARDGIDPGSGNLKDLIELPNGCVCCTVKDSLVETLECLIDKRSDLDYILIEASGMADPGPIASVFWLDEALESRLRLDGIVTLVDGKHILQQLAETEEAARQIAYADRIVLNKVDLLDGANGRHSVRDVEQALRRIQPNAPILKTSFSKIPDLDWILDADCFGGMEHLEEIQNGLDEANREEEEHDHDHGHDHSHDHDHHDCSECCHEDHEHHHHHSQNHHEEGDEDHHHHHHHNDHKDNHHHDNHHHHHHHEHKHTSSITTIALEHSGSVDVRKLNSWLADILWPDQDAADKVLTALLHQQEKEIQQQEATNQQQPQEPQALEASPRDQTPSPESTTTTSEPATNLLPGGHAEKDEASGQQIFRIKGIVSIFASEDYELAHEENNEAAIDATSTASTTDPRRFIVQAVHDLWDVQPVTSRDLYWKPTDARNGKIVVIGKHLEEERLRTGFLACFEPP